MGMLPRELRRRIRELEPNPSITTRFEYDLMKRGVRSSTNVWYDSQKEHWLGWLKEYNGPGAFGRKNWQRSAEFVYNHVVCPPMVLWLGEAAGIATRRVREAKKAALCAERNFSAQSAAIRKIIRYSEIEALLLQKSSN